MLIKKNLYQKIINIILFIIIQATLMMNITTNLIKEIKTKMHLLQIYQIKTKV